MATSLKAELDIWAAALKAYDEQDFEKALDSFSRIADSSKILTNMGLIYATIGEHEAAVQQFMAATALDPFLAIAYFQCGVSNFLLSRYDVALQNFDDALLYLRGNQAINYEQIGLKFKLFSPEVLFNKGLSHIYLGYPAEGLAEMENGRNLKVTDEHDVIDDAIRDRGEGYTVFSIPVGVLYRPSENKLKNSKSKDYLGKAASDATDAFTEFTGVKKLKEEREKAKERDEERDDDGLKRSATVPPLRTEPIVRPSVERSKTTNAGPRPTTPAFPSTADIALALPPTSGLSRSNTVAPVRINISTFASSRSPTDGTLALSPTSPLTRNNSAPPSRSNTLIRPTTPSGVAASRGLTIRKKEPLPSQLVNQPGALFQPPFAPQQLYQDQPPPARNQYQQPQPYQTQTLPDNGYQVPPSSLQPSLPVPKAPFVLRAAPPSQEVSVRQLDFLDDYIGSLPNMGLDRVALWPQGSAQSGPGSTDSSTGSMIRRMPMRRKPTRRGTQRRPKPTYEEEEEGYVSEEYDDSYDLANIRVKLHYRGEVRGMTLTSEATFEEFVERVTSKFSTTMDGLGLKFKDEDDVKVTLRDGGDFELAIETVRANAKGRGEGKLEIWCTDM
ncbi:hypothetical protein DFJ58DRAFT_798850 [Suillus subalutaceus]|uniref:uncharacterized protein n=1 Tax=Suillus subalutaceus TaxID=48586 RepID=UPI001B86BBD1|nr:uncharacterized protein DFJ58DRAFT_798850 [Suillus subalutaceus]KAG1846575.1 hypothetical protein DFJ58DRAFT_798850 [Suillus subalutaceus]